MTDIPAHVLLEKIARLERRVAALEAMAPTLEPTPAPAPDDPRYMLPRYDLRGRTCAAMLPYGWTRRAQYPWQVYRNAFGGEVYLADTDADALTPDLISVLREMLVDLSGHGCKMTASIRDGRIVIGWIEDSRPRFRFN